MKANLKLQQRLILPIVLLGIVTLLSNILAVFSINNVHHNAGTIVDEYMVNEAKLENIRRSMMDIHRLALSHIVAADHVTMIQLVGQIKESEAGLDDMLEEYEGYVPKGGQQAYSSLLSNYDAFKHALVLLVCASADSKTQEAYAMANGDAALYSQAATADMDALSALVSELADSARDHLSFVYIISIISSIFTLVMGVLLVAAGFRIVKKDVMAPIRDAMGMLSDSSERITGVVGEVRHRVETSSGNVNSLSQLTQKLSAALQGIAGSSGSISSSASDMRDSSKSMAEECSAITAYSAEMRARAEDMEKSAAQEMKAVRARTAEIMATLDQAIEKSRSVNQIGVLTKDILSISSSTDLIAVNASIEASRAGEAGRGFAIVAREVRQLAETCAGTANHIQEVSQVVTSAVNYLSSSARELSGYLSKALLDQLELSVAAGQQYRKDAGYIKQEMEAFNTRTIQLKSAMDEIARDIADISGAIEGAVRGVNGAAGSTRGLVDDMAGIAGRMDANQEIAGELKRQMDVFANL